MTTVQHLRGQLTTPEAREVYGLLIELGARFTAMKNPAKTYLSVNVETRAAGGMVYRSVSAGWGHDFDSGMQRLKEALIQQASQPGTLVFVASKEPGEKVFVYDTIRREFTLCSGKPKQTVKVDRPESDRLSEADIAEKGLLTPAKKLPRMEINR